MFTYTVAGDFDNEKDALDYAANFVWSECECVWRDNLPNTREVAVVNGVKVLYDFAGDYYIYAEDPAVMTGWVAQDAGNSTYLGEWESGVDENINFVMVRTDTHILFGGAVNTGFLESGNWEIDESFSFDENLQYLCETIDEYYEHGAANLPENFSCNDRM